MTEPTLFDVAQKIPDSALQRYHNTTNLIGDILKQREVRTSSQNGKILEFFQKSYSTWSPSEVMQAMNLPGVPLTSYRRAITDLTKMGLLVKTDIKRPGMYGSDEYCWRGK